MLNSYARAMGFFTILSIVCLARRGCLEPVKEFYNPSFQVLWLWTPSGRFASSPQNQLRLAPTFGRCEKLYGFSGKVETFHSHSCIYWSSVTLVEVI